MATTAASNDSELHGSIVIWLTSPTAYPHRPAAVQCVQTHISCVLLAGSEVYKLKKPVRFEFLDFSTLAAREHACREEVRLNRRLASQVYVDVVPVTAQPGGGFALGGDGEVVDWLVHMRRLPDDRMLDVLHRRGELRPDHIDQLAELLARFYATAKPVPITAEEYRARCLAHVHGNLDELLAAATHHLTRTTVQRVQGFQLQLLLLLPELFAARVHAGRIVEGHGDLRPEHICFADPMAIFDCIEFNAEFRQLDMADELAFLAAECDLLGARWVGLRLLQRFQDLSGDRPPPILLDFYKSYRASVRAKVAALRADQLEGAAREQAAQDASAHLALADGYVAPHLQPLVVVVGGLSGTGKSTLARELAKALGAELLRSDAIRQDLFADAMEGHNQGKYRPEARERVYQEMFRQAAELHSQRVSVVLDATFGNTANLLAARAIAANPQAIFLAIECHCSPEVAKQRILDRRITGSDVSEANLTVLELQQATRDPWPDEVRPCRVDTEQPLANQVRQVLDALAHLSDSR